MRLSTLLSALRYGVEPPVLVKLEKEIELEETLLMTEEPPPAVKTFSVCCQHGGLYQAGVSRVRNLPPGGRFSSSSSTSSSRDAVYMPRRSHKTSCSRRIGAGLQLITLGGTCVTQLKASRGSCRFICAPRGVTHHGGSCDAPPGTPCLAVTELSVSGPLSLHPNHF